MIVTFYHNDGRKPLEIEFDSLPELGDVITVDGQTAWINAIGQQFVGVDQEHQWHGQYTFDREKYFK